MAKMFRRYEDQNGVITSCNSHPSEEFTQPESDQRLARPHWMAGHDGREGYLEPAATTLVHKAKDRVLGTGARPGMMTFEGDLLPRSERVSREQAGRAVEGHAPGCWCPLCCGNGMEGPTAPTPQATRAAKRY